MRAGLIAAIVLILAASLAAALHAGPAAIGWLAALAMFAFAAAAGAAARSVHAPGDLEEPRHPHGPSDVALPPPEVTVTRGTFGRLWAYAAGAFGIAALVPLVALRRAPAARPPVYARGTRLVTSEGRALKADDLARNAVETVFPQNKIGQPDSATLLIRLQDDLVREQPGHAGWTPQGNIAYSKICTHAGCPVAIYRQESYQLYCPCHQSVFDVLDAAKPLAGPATRALPQLALDVDAEGYLIARGDFDAPVGPDEWWRAV